MNIRSSTKDYEQWLGKQLVNRGGCDEWALKEKCKLMKNGDDHSFLRATFYRWASLWTGLHNGGPKIVSVGDIHIENFGTWRKETGKRTLVWGVNDFDESCVLPWTNDLVRLGVSATFAIRELNDSFHIKSKRACRTMLKSYTDALLNDTAKAFVLRDDNDPFCRLVKKMIPGIKQTAKKYFKDRQGDLAPIKIGALEKDLRKALKRLQKSLPAGTRRYSPYQLKPHALVGLGSLGKRRFYALVKDDSLIYEIKPAIASACEWAKGTDGQNADTKLLKSSRRVPDPSQDVNNGWIVRRRGSDAQKLELDKFERNRDAKKEALLFTNMAIELANLHRTNSKKKIEAVVTDLKQRNKKDPDWFLKLVAKWVKKMENDHKKFKKG
ncbi:MAG: DUF2252 family protein [Candidatus Accumulibacter sp.]|uniref:DUF2252 family protein n=1 Tax=Accumulibacter sp. TaxID=2053492 RepID=UPI0025861EF7|nr:DUF2252 family protein [Accumulibacter sp.]MBK8115007.1 DUF2252 family protein [Accumulibacter sp.]